MAYRRAPYTEGGDLTEYLQRELENIENEFNRIAGGFAFTLLKAEPPKPRLGQVVLADGVNWGPLATDPHLTLFDGVNWVGATGVKLTEWTPTLTAQTPGDLSVTYGAGADERHAISAKIGRFVFMMGRISATLVTHSTASGQLRVAGLPHTVGGNNLAVAPVITRDIAYASGATAVMGILDAGVNFIRFNVFGSAGTPVSPVNITDITSGATGVVLRFSGCYVAED